MKKFAVILILAVFVALAAGACNKKTCPAYKNQMARTERIG